MSKRGGTTSSLSEMIAQKRKQQQQQQQQQAQKSNQQQQQSIDDEQQQQEQPIDWDSIELQEWNNLSKQEQSESVVVAYDESLTRLHISQNGRYPERPNRLSRSMETLRDLLKDIEKTTTERHRNIQRMPLVVPGSTSPSVVSQQHRLASNDEIILACNHQDFKDFIIDNKPLPNLSSDLFIDEKTSREAALRAAALTIDATVGVWNRKWKHAFALVRPPGHHSGTEKCHGFCLVNNAAVAAAAILKMKQQQQQEEKDQEHKNTPKRISIIDIDVHHGDGTQSLCDELNKELRRMKQQESHNDNDNILFISTHRYDNGSFFPGTGHPNSFGPFGLNFNIAFNTQPRPSLKQQQQTSTTNSTPPFHCICDYTMQTVTDEFLIPILFDAKLGFHPDIILISCGFDAADGDPLGGQGVSKNGYRYVFERLASECDNNNNNNNNNKSNDNNNNTNCKGIVGILEGGYDVEIVSNYFTEVVMSGLSSTTTNRDIAVASLQPPSHWQIGRQIISSTSNNNELLLLSLSDESLKLENQTWTRKTIQDLCRKYLDEFSVKKREQDDHHVNQKLLEFCASRV